VASHRRHSGVASASGIEDPSFTPARVLCIFFEKTAMLLDKADVKTLHFCFQLRNEGLAQK
jgi:hypothetical protein